MPSTGLGLSAPGGLWIPFKLTVNAGGKRHGFLVGLADFC